MSIKKSLSIIGIIVMVCLILNNHSSTQNAGKITDLSIEVAPNTSQEKEWVDIWDKYDRDYGHGVAINNVTGNVYITGNNLTGPPGGYPDGVLLSMYSSSGVCIWNKTWDPAGYHRGRDISIDSQGYVYIAGATNKEGNYDVLLIKFDQNGEEIWNVTWNGGASDNGWALFIDKDDYIYVTGHSYNGGNFEDIVILKYNSSGDLEWSDVYGGTDFEGGYDVAVDSSGYVYITGYIDFVGNDILTVKYNNSGNFEDYRIFDPSNDDQGKSIAIDSNDNVYITGYTNLTGNHNIIILKYDSDLNSQWFKNWGLTNSDEGYGIAIDSNNNIYVAGFTTAPDLNIDVALLKYNSIGNYQWNFTWNATSDSDIRDWCRNIALDSSDNIYLVGETLDTSVFPVLSDMFLMKITQESEPSNGDGNGFEIPGYELFVFTTTSILIIAVIIKKFRKN